MYNYMLNNSIPVHTASLQMDIYKNFHPAAYHEDVEEVEANYINRSGKYSNVPDGSYVVHVGLQSYTFSYLIEEWNRTFFSLPKEVAVANHKAVMDAMLGYENDVERYEELHDLGYLPLEIRAVPEGTVLPYGVAPFAMRNTHPNFRWLANGLETVTSAEVWPISTSCTTSIAYMAKAREYFAKTGKPMDLLSFMGHDFSFRGMFGRQAAAMSGFGHLAAGWCGTDTVPAVLYAAQYYGAKIGEELIGASVNATEHSVMCASLFIFQKELEETGECRGHKLDWLKYVLKTEDTLLCAEFILIEKLMDEVAPEGILSIVCDSNDFWEVVMKILPALKDKILARDGKIVVRPDSGDPVKILTGYVVADQEDWYEYGNFCEAVRLPDGRVYRVQDLVEYLAHLEGAQDQGTKGLDGFTPLMECETKGLIEVLAEQFGTEPTELGYHELNPKIGAIYGDSITLERQDKIYSRLADKGFCPEPVLGIGSFTFQFVTRDTHGSAFKATNVVLKDGSSIALEKNPKTDPSKRSAKGIVRVDKDEDGNIFMEQGCSREEATKGMMDVVFLDGQLMKFQTLEDIRQTVAQNMGW